jgi:hypothetical protein
MEVFNQYFFSMNIPDNPENSDNSIIDNNNKYVRFFYLNNQLNGVLMMNDKENAKKYEQAVREKWDKNKVATTFGL